MERIKRIWMRFIKMASHNWGLKVVAVLFALLLWSFIVASDPTLIRAKVLDTNSYRVSGLDSLKNAGFTISEDIEAKMKNVKVTVNIPQRYYNDSQISSATVVADVSNLKESGAQRVYFSVIPPQNTTFVKADPAYIEVNVEEYVTKTIPVRVSTYGELAEGLWCDTGQVEPSHVSVSGPRSLVESVVRADVPVDLGQGVLNGSFENPKFSAIIYLRDSRNGSVINKNLFMSDPASPSTVLKYGTVTMPVYHTKEVPIDTSPISGTPSPGYVVTNITTDPAAVIVAASSDVLANIDRILVTSTDITGTASSMNFDTKLQRVSDVRYISANTVQANVTITETMASKRVRNLVVEIDNLDDGYVCKLRNSRVSVTIEAPYSAIQQLNSSDVVVRAYVDVRGMSEGEHEAPLLLECAELDGVEYTIDPSYIELTIKPEDG